MNQNFLPDLRDGQIGERLVAYGLARRNIPFQQTAGKVYHDFELPNGKLEVKTQWLSGFTGNSAFEDDLFKREWDYLWNITLMHKIYTRDEVWQMCNQLYERRRVQMGDREDHFGTLVPIVASKHFGLYESQFTKQLCSQSTTLPSC